MVSTNLMPCVHKFKVHKYEFIDVHSAVSVEFRTVSSSMTRTVIHNPPTLHSLLTHHLRDTLNLSDQTAIPQATWDTQMSAVHAIINEKIQHIVVEFKALLGKGSTSRAWALLWSSILEGFQQHIRTGTLKEYGTPADWQAYAKIKFRRKKVFEDFKVDTSQGLVSEHADNASTKEVLLQLRRARQLEHAVIKQLKKKQSQCFSHSSASCCHQ